MAHQNNLSPEEQEQFELRLKELAMDPSQVVDELVTGATPGATILSDDPAIDSAIKSSTLTIYSLDEAKRLGGNIDALFESGEIANPHTPLPEWPAHKNDRAPQDLEPEENGRIRQAFSAYVYGHSEKVKSYKDIIEKHYFPLTVSTFAIKNVTISPGHPLILEGGNQAYNYGILTIEDGGEIQVKANNVTMTCQKIISKSSSA